MPKIAGVNILGLVLGALAMWILGFVWFGVLFSEAWMSASGFTEEMFDGQSPLWMPAGFVISLLLTFGLGWHMKQKNISKLGTAVLFGLWLSLLIGLPLIAYDTVYTPYGSLMGFFVDGSHTVATIVAACAVLSFFD